MREIETICKFMIHRHRNNSQIWYCAHHGPHESFDYPGEYYCGTADRKLRGCIYYEPEKEISEFKIPKDVFEI